MIVGLALFGCASLEPEIYPAKVTQAGGVELRIRLGGAGGNGSAIVLIDGVPTHSTVVEAPGLLRVRLPPLPRPGVVDAEVRFADGSSVHIPGELEVVSPELQVRPAT